jgi:WhiB family redox-sensing transcriptional regulator
VSRRNTSTAEELQKTLWEATERSLDRDPSRWKWQTSAKEPDKVKWGVARSKSPLNPFPHYVPDGLHESLWDWTWRKRAACAGEDPELFYKPEATRVYPPEQLHKAKAICGGCSVREQCLAVAMAISAPSDDGVWGGLTEDERQALRKRRCLECRKPLKGRRITKRTRFCSDDC